MWTEFILCGKQPGGDFAYGCDEPWGWGGIDWKRRNSYGREWVGHNKLRAEEMEGEEIGSDALRFTDGGKELDKYGYKKKLGGGFE